MSEPVVQSQEEEIKKREPKMEDVGTRYEHLLEYKESLEECKEIVKRMGKDNTPIMGKLNVAIEVATTTLDAFSGYKNSSSEYQLYKLLNSVPRTKEGLIEIGGTPLD